MLRASNELTVLAPPVTAVALTGGSAGSVPTTLRRTLDVSRRTTGHCGTFTALAPLCSAGTFLADGVRNKTFTCGDGSGTFHS